jgi:hypothetical protein
MEEIIPEDGAAEKIYQMAWNDLRWLRAQESFKRFLAFG